MNYAMIFWFFVIISKTDIHSTQSTKILGNAHVSSILVTSVIKKAFISAQDHQVKEMEYKIGDSSDRKTNGFLQNLFGGFFRTKTTTISANSCLLEDFFGTKIIFRDVNFYFHHEDRKRTTWFSLVKQNEFDDQIRVSTHEFRITLEMELRRDTNEPFSGFELFTTLHFKNFVLIATRTNETKFAFDLSYKDYSVWNYGARVKIQWIKHEYDFPGSGEDDLTREITPILPLLLREHINRNPEFTRALDNIIAKSF